MVSHRKHETAKSTHTVHYPSSTTNTSSSSSRSRRSSAERVGGGGRQQSTPTGTHHQHPGHHLTARRARTLSARRPAPAANGKRSSFLATTKNAVAGARSASAMRGHAWSHPRFHSVARHYLEDASDDDDEEHAVEKRVLLPIAPGGSISWLTAAWVERRGVFQLPFVQRMGEMFLRHRAAQQEKEMKHFLRLYRHLMSGAHHRGTHGLPVASPSPADKTLQRSGFAAAAAAESPPSSTSDPKGGDGDDAGLEEEDAAEELKAAAIVNSYESQQAETRALLRPEPMSLLPALSVQERRSMKDITRNNRIRSCVYAIIAVLLVTLGELYAAQSFLGSGATLFNSNTFTASNFEAITAIFTTTWAGKNPFVDFSSLTNSTTGLLVPSSLSTPPSSTDLIKYWVAVAAVTIVVSALEVFFLYSDLLDTSFALAKIAGVPLHHHTNRRSARFMQRAENETITIRESLSRKRVRFVITALCQCALDIPHTRRSVMGISATHRGDWCIRRLGRRLMDEVGRSAPIFVIRFLAARIVSKVAAPLFASPLLVLWNFLVSRTAARRSTLVVMGTVSVERLVEGILAQYLHRARYGADCMQGPRYLPFHVYKEAVCLLAYMAWLQKTVHPALHLALVAMISMTDVLEPPTSECSFTDKKHSKAPQGKQHRTAAQAFNQEASNIDEEAVAEDEEEEEEPDLEAPQTIFATAGMSQKQSVCVTSFLFLLNKLPDAMKVVKSLRKRSAEGKGEICLPADIATPPKEERVNHQPHQLDHRLGAGHGVSAYFSCKQSELDPLQDVLFPALHHCAPVRDSVQALKASWLASNAATLPLWQATRAATQTTSNREGENPEELQFTNLVLSPYLTNASRRMLFALCCLVTAATGKSKSQSHLVLLYYLYRCAHGVLRSSALATTVAAEEEDFVLERFQWTVKKLQRLEQAYQEGLPVSANHFVEFD